MNVNLNELLPCILYIALIVLVIILIVLSIKLMKTLKKVDSVLDDVDSKMKKVDGIFNIIDRATDFANSVSDKVINGISGTINKVFKRKRGKKDE